MNKIKENKTAIFLTLIRSEGYKVLKSLSTPNLPKDVKYEQLVSNMKNYLQPKVSILVERSKFHNRISLGFLNSKHQSDTNVTSYD